MNVSVSSLKGNFSDSFYYTGQEADGFFLPSGNYYYYPTNFPVREYQKTIIETALFNNTLVVLPTGILSLIRDCGNITFNWVIC